MLINLPKQKMNTKGSMMRQWSRCIIPSSRDTRKMNNYRMRDPKDWPRDRLELNVDTLAYGIDH
jgi:hypothetical protein